MKKVLFFVLVLLVLPYAYSAPCYGTKMPKKGQWFWGLQANSVEERNLEGINGEFSATQGFITGTFGIFDWLCFDGKLGYGGVEYDPASISEIDYDPSFAGAYGFRIKLYDKPQSKFKSVVGFQHISVHPHHEIVNNQKRKVVFDDWQLSLLVSYQVGKKFVPYLGGKISRGDLIEWIDESRDRYKSEGSEVFGAAAGFDFYLTENCWLNLEARFFDEKAASVALTRSF